MPHPPRATRVALDSQAVVHLKGRQVHGRTLDLSLTGVAIQCEGPLHLGLPVWVGFGLDEFPGWLALHAVVVRKQPAETGAVWGLQFKGLDATLVDCLRGYVQGKQSVFVEEPPPAIP